MFKENFNKILCYDFFFYKNVFKLRCTLLRLYSNADSIILFSPGRETFHVLSI